MYIYLLCLPYKVTWDDPKELESFIINLQSIADRLTSENRRLRKCHNTLIDKVHVHVHVPYE